MTQKLTDSQLSFEELLRTFFKRKYWIVGCLIFGLILAGVYTLLKPRYTATGLLIVEPGRSAAYEASPFAGEGAGDEKISAEVAVLSTETLIIELARKLDLANNPDFISRPLRDSRKHYSIDDPLVRDEVVRQFRKQVVISRGLREEVVTISCTTYSPLLSAQIVNTLTELYIQRVFEMRYGTVTRVTNWMETQLEGLHQQVEADQVKLVGLQQDLGVLGLSEANHSYLATDSLQALAKASTDATIERLVSEARLQYLKNMDPNLIESESPVLPQQNNGVSLLQTLRGEQATAAANYAKLSQQFGKNYPPLKQAKAQLDAINAQIDQEQKRILSQATVAYQAAKSNEQMTQGALNAQKNQAFDLHNKIVAYNILQREYISHRDLYEGLLRHLREASSDAGLKSADVDVLDVAEVPSVPAGPSKPIVLLVGAFGGLLFGFALAFMIEFLDSRLSDPVIAEKYLDLALLGTVPVVPFERRPAGSEDGARAIQAELSNVAYAEAMQVLRSNLLVSTPGKPPTTILVTSSIPAEGKSTVSRNLALTFASHHQRVLLIDADLRRPTQHLRGKVSNASGLSNALTSNVSVLDLIVAYPGYDNIFLLPAGPVPPNPASLLGSAEMHALMAKAARDFDVVIVDSAPIMSTADTLQFAEAADAVLLVVKQNAADRRAVLDTKNSLIRVRAKVVGFTMNAMNYATAGYYSYGGYGSGYGSYEADKEAQ